jgi:ABC-type transport system involved in multi-copper enzyme maturation permease subunit
MQKRSESPIRNRRRKISETSYRFRHDPFDISSAAVVFQLRGAVMGAPLPPGESLLIAWTQTVGLIASTIVLFVAGYVAFQRQEVAT